MADGLNIPEKLVQSGILKETTGYARKRVFLADEILQAVEGLEH